MSKLMIAFAATMALASLGGCKKKSGAGSAEAMAKMAEFKERMCKCTDPACAHKVDEDMTKWTQEAAKASKGPVELSEAEQKKYNELGQQMGDCSTKATGTAAGSGSDMAGSAAGSAAAGSGSAAAGSAAAGSGSAAGAGSAAAGSGSAAAAGSAAAGSGSAAAAGSAAAGSAAPKK